MSEESKYAVCCRGRGGQATGAHRDTHRGRGQRWCVIDTVTYHQHLTMVGY